MYNNEEFLHTVIFNYITKRKLDGIGIMEIIKEIETELNKIKSMSGYDLEYTCCICGKNYRGYGNNPYPLEKTGRCCDSCNNKVIEARFSNILNGKTNEN